MLLLQRPSARMKKCVEAVSWDWKLHGEKHAEHGLSASFRADGAHVRIPSHWCSPVMNMRTWSARDSAYRYWLGHSLRSKQVQV